MTTVTKTLRICNRLGLHARAAALFVKTASRFQSEISVGHGKKTVNGKSIMGLLMLAAGQGTRIIVEISGPDADQAMQKIAKLVEAGFNEK